ncbi:MAG: LCP family protein [Tenericutes bacterium]|nr:LCP family protein [Mycoplasmatota bacterium]
MAKEDIKTNKTKPIIRIIVLVLTVLAVSAGLFAIYEIYSLESIENLIRYIVMGVLGVSILIIILKTLGIWKGKKKKKESKRIGFIIFLITYTLICLAVGGVIFYLMGKLNNLNKDKVTYSSSIVVLSKTEIKELKDIKNLKIGMYNNEKSPDGYIIPMEIIKEYNLNDENEIVNYDDYSSMITDLYVGEINAAFLPTGYAETFSLMPGYENIKDDTRIITSKEKQMKESETSSVETASAGKLVTEPFTILLMGIDSTEEVLPKNAIANGDTLIVMTFNPKTLNATILSVPRDSYVPIACWSGNPKNKITHAAAYGNDCMMNTIQNYLGINIDYYAKINFKGLVKLVDAVGGIEMDVDQRLCTDDSSRWGEVCIEAGHQTLNGEQALVYARNRYDLIDGDFGRNRHQQEIVLALANKIKDVKDVGQFMSILDTVSNSMDTNLTTKQMLSFYDIAKDIVLKSLSSPEADLVNIQQLYLAGNGQMIYDERARRVLWDYIPNEYSRKDIVQTMKENLGLVGVEAIKTFSFSINEPYEKEIIGKGPYARNTLYTLLPDFTGDTEAAAKATAQSLGLKVSFIGDKTGTVVAQNYPFRKRVDLINDTLVLTLSDGKSKDDNTTKDDEKDTDKDKDNDKDTDKDNDTDKDTGKDNDTDKDKDTGKDDNEDTPTPTPEPTPDDKKDE